MKIKYAKKEKDKTESESVPGGLKIALLLILVYFLGVLSEQRNLYAQLGNLELFDRVAEEINAESFLYRESALPTIYLDIPFDSMLAITEKREEALQMGLLIADDEDFVPASLRMSEEGKSWDIKLRLKGDQTDHLEGTKWSFRVHINEDGGTVLGTERFSLQPPFTRNYIHEWGYHQNLMQENVLTTRYSFVNLVINGEHKGIYAFEESFTEDLLESQGRREGIILRYDEDIRWLDWADRTDELDGSDFWLTEGYELNETTPFRETHIASNPTLAAESLAASELLASFIQNNATGAQVLDETLWGKYYAITDLWVAGHASIWHNQRFYYNPVSGLIEPLAFDAIPLQTEYLKNPSDFYFEPFFVSPGVQKAYVETLERITQPAYINELEDAFGEEINLYVQSLRQEYVVQQAPAAITPPWDLLRQRAAILAGKINPVQPVRGNYHLIDDQTLELDLINMMILPVELKSLRWGDETITLDELQCNGSPCDLGLAAVQDAFVLASIKADQKPHQLSFQLPLSAFSSPHSLDEVLTLFVSLYGGSKTFEIPIGTNYVPQGITQGMLPIASLEEALAAHPFLLELGDKKLGIAQGEWDVNKDLVLPTGYSLSIPAGTTLRFGTDISFVVRGRVDMLGTEDAPITITSQNGAWGGMLILKADETSTWEYVRVSDAHGVPYPGMGITGGVTFYESDIHIRNSQIGNNQTEDALNVIQSEFYFEQVEFLNAPSDAFDGDFVQGTVVNCSFHDIVGDGVDVSGSTVTVKDSYFVALGDKAVSAGEHSIITAENLTIRDVGIGVASKDLSEVTLSATTIDGARVAGLAAYIKKPQYGAASITAIDVAFLNTPKPAFCQTESEIILNGENILAEDFDVDALYEQGVLGN